MRLGHARVDEHQQAVGSLRRGMLADIHDHDADEPAEYLANGHRPPPGS
jgi:hypothetical protein